MDSASFHLPLGGCCPITVGEASDSAITVQPSYKSCKSLTSFENEPVTLLLLSLPQSFANPVQADCAVLAVLSRGLRGGEILDICLNAIHAGSEDADGEKWRVTQEMLEREIAKARRAKAEHARAKVRKAGRRIGFVP